MHSLPEAQDLSQMGLQEKTCISWVGAFSYTKLEQPVKSASSQPL